MQDPCLKLLSALCFIWSQVNLTSFIFIPAGGCWAHICRPCPEGDETKLYGILGRDRRWKWVGGNICSLIKEFRRSVLLWHSVQSAWVVTLKTLNFFEIWIVSCTQNLEDSVWCHTSKNILTNREYEQIGTCAIFQLKWKQIFASAFVAYWKWLQ